MPSTGGRSHCALSQKCSATDLLAKTPGESFGRLKISCKNRNHAPSMETAVNTRSSDASVSKPLMLNHPLLEPRTGPWDHVFPKVSRSRHDPFLRDRCQHTTYENRTAPTGPTFGIKNRVVPTIPKLKSTRLALRDEQQGMPFCLSQSAVCTANPISRLAMSLSNGA